MQARRNGTDRARVALTGAFAIIAMGSTSAGARVVQVGRAPYPTLAAAVAAVPALKGTLRPGESLELVLPPGVTRLSAPVLIGAAHGGTADAPLVIRGAADGSSSLSGAATIPFRRARPADAPGLTLPGGTLAIDLAGVPGAAALDRRGAQIPTPPSSLQLFQGRRWLSPSRWPATGYASGAAAGANGAGPLVALPPPLAKAWAREPALWAEGYWGADWEYERVPVRSVAVAGMRLEPLRAQQPVRASVRFRVENAISALAAGRFVVLPGRRIALVLPMPGPFGFEATVTPTLLRLDHSAHVRIADLDVGRSGGDAIQVADSNDVSIENCFVHEAGGNGIMVSGGAGVAIRHTIVAATGERGVVLGGGARTTLSAAGHGFIDGIVADFGRLSPSYRPGIDLWGVGNRVSGSIVAGGDHAGILVSGNDHVIADNEIRDVLRDSEDAGAVYMGADWTQRGNVVAGNYIHRLGNPARPTRFLVGVYLDDQFSGTRITGNVIVGGDFGAVIGGGRDNLVTDNMVAFPTRGAVFIDARGLGSQRARTAEFVHKLQAMPVTSAAWRNRYPTLAKLAAAQYGEPAGNVVRGNALVRVPGDGVPVLADGDGARTYVTVADNIVREAAVIAGQKDRTAQQLIGTTRAANIMRQRVPELQAKLAASTR